MKYLKWFHNTIKPYRWSVIFQTFCQIVIVALSMGYVFVSKALIDVATGRSGSDVKKGLMVYASAMIGIIFIKILTQAFKTYTMTKASTKMKNQMRQKHFNNLLHLEGEIRGKFHSGDVLNRVKEDVSVVGNACCANIPNIIGAACQFIAAFIYLAYLEAKLAWLLVIILPTGFFGGRYLMRKIKSLTLEVRKDDSLVQAHLQESIQHQTLIKSLEYDSHSSSTLTELQGCLYDKTMKRTKFALVARIVVALTMSLGYATAFLWGAFGIWKGTVTYGIMTAFLQLVGQLQRPLYEIGQELPALFNSTASIDRLEELNSLPVEKEDNPQMLEGTAGIRICNVTFKYEDGTNVILKDFSHDFKPGSRTAIVGPTGAGKSTTIKLMLSLLTPDKGRIELYDETGNVLQAGPNSRCNLVYVPQGNSLFSGSIRDNLLMGNPMATDDELVSALKTAASEFVFDLPSGIDTQCFEAGGGLSEGQAQRIAIARGLLRPGSILLLDELTSALDPETEATLLERLTAKMTGRTMIFITHREKIAEYCDNTLIIS